MKICPACLATGQYFYCPKCRKAGRVRKMYSAEQLEARIAVMRGEAAKIKQALEKLKEVECQEHPIHEQ